MLSARAPFTLVQTIPSWTMPFSFGKRVKAVDPTRKRREEWFDTSRGVY
jgi:hypothetical protein